MEIVLFACIILFIVALADFAWQKYDMTQKMKMTKEEVKQERKDQEGNDQVKGEIRRRGIENARASIQAAIPESDVVVTNPSHYAIALKYQPGDPAPIVLAKGIDYKAQYIKELAREHNIAMVEDKPLARTLYASCKVGSCIPIELFQAVARILAYVYRTRGGKSSQPRA
jgi:flagellar biosynthetic protein FlhB